MIRTATVCLVLCCSAGTASADVTADGPPSEPSVPRARVGLQYGAEAFSPMWTGRMRDRYRPGIGILGRIGFEFAHGLSLEGGMGVHWNPAVVDTNPDLTNVFSSVSARYGVLNPTAFVPFARIGLQVNLWDICDEDRVCSQYSEPTVGFLGSVGLVYELDETAAFEFGVHVRGSFPGEVFERGVFSAAPFVGFTFYD